MLVKTKKSFIVILTARQHISINDQGILYLSLNIIVSKLTLLFLYICVSTQAFLLTFTILLVCRVYHVISKSNSIFNSLQEMEISGAFLVVAFLTMFETIHCFDGGWYNAHATFYGSSDASGTMGMVQN